MDGESGTCAVRCCHISALMIVWIRAFLALWSSGSSCPFDPLSSIGLVVGLSGLVIASYSAGLYLGVFGLVSEWNVLLPKLGLSGVCNHASVSRGDTTAGVSARASNQLSLGCLGMANGMRVVTVCM